MKTIEIAQQIESWKDEQDDRAALAILVEKGNADKIRTAFVSSGRHNKLVSAIVHLMAEDKDFRDLIIISVKNYLDYANK